MRTFTNAHKNNKHNAPNSIDTHHNPCSCASNKKRKNSVAAMYNTNIT